MMICRRTISGRAGGVGESVQIRPSPLNAGALLPITWDVGLLRGAGAAGAAAIATVALAACGEEKVAETPAVMSSPRVALTASLPGYAPFALIVYRDADGRRCHGVGSVTASGPRVMGALGDTLADGLRTGGKCLKATDSDVSLQVRRVGRGTARVVGGIVRAGVTRLVVGGQRVRPQRDGSFLVVQPAGSGALGEEVELEYTAGHNRRLPLRRVSS